VLKPKITISQEEIALVNEVATVSVGDEKSGFANLSASLAEIRKLKGVLGYILRNNESAILDLNPDEIIQYAMFSSQIHDSCQEIAKQFNLGETESMLVEGSNVKALCISLGEKKISVLMDKSAAHAWIIKRILL
jgi:predicted regulator of Ras-like GTPase activity (Roadblock/LC7/MglB family)